MSKQSTNKPNNRLFAPLAIGFFIGVIVVGTAALVWNHDRETRSYPVYRAAETAPAPTAPAALDSTAFSSFSSTTSPAADPSLARVAARFVCSCGSCNEERLNVCSCPTAQEERAFIQQQLHEGRTETEAAEALKQKYGGMKS